MLKLRIRFKSNQGFDTAIAIGEEQLQLPRSFFDVIRIPKNMGGSRILSDLS